MCIRDRGLKCAVSDLRLPKRNSKRRQPLPRFDGRFRDDEGNVVSYNLARAEREAYLATWRIRLGRRFLEHALIKLPKPFRSIFADGHLPHDPATPAPVAGLN